MPCSEVLIDEVCRFIFSEELQCIGYPKVGMTATKEIQDISLAFCQLKT
jgi:hypothetical protein